MNLGDSFALNNTSKLTSDQCSYFEWLQHRLKDIRQAVTENLTENKQEMKAEYDKRNKVKDPTFKVGDKVLLESKRVKPGSDCVLTQRPFSGPYFVSDVIAGNGIGEAHKLIHVNNGRSIKSLVSGDRLKLYEVDKRGELSGRLPGVQAPSEIKPAKDRNDGFEPAVKILRQNERQQTRVFSTI